MRVIRLIIIPFLSLVYYFFFCKQNLSVISIVFGRKFDIPRDVPEPSSAQVEAAEAMIRRLRFPYDPEKIDNPVIQTHYKNLEAMALDKDAPEEIVDYTSMFVSLIRSLGNKLSILCRRMCGNSLRILLLSFTIEYCKIRKSTSRV